MTDLLRSPWAADFDSLLARTSTSLVICAPYVGRGPCRRVKSQFDTVRSSPFQLLLVTDLSLAKILSGATDVAAIADLARAIPTITIRFIPSLHAKVYIADDECAIVTSGNFTDGGLLRNLEYGVRFTEREKVARIKRDVLDYSLLGSPINRAQLNVLASAALELRELQRAAERDLRSRMRREFDRRVRQVDEDLLRVRVGGRTSHAIFTETILYLLRGGPMRTVDINREVQRIHPDLCDDTTDRVIDGERYGKLWKHAVRSAQQALVRRGDILRESDKWRRRE